MDFIPLSTGGANAGLKLTIVPGAGKAKSWAWAKGNGPNVLTKKTKTSPRAINLRFFIVFIIDTESLTYLYKPLPPEHLFLCPGS